MPKDIINKETREELRKYFATVSWRIIEMEFEDAGVARDRTYYDPQISEEHRQLVEQYYHTLDFTKPDDARKFRVVYEDVLRTLESQLEPDTHFGKQAAEWLKRLVAQIRKEGFEYKGGHLVPVGESEKARPPGA